MFKFLVLSLALASAVAPSACDLQSAQDERLDPLNDADAASDASPKDQDKRTIFGPTIQNFAWAKHVAVHPGGGKRLLGFGPVDLRYAPVPRPHLGYHYDRPRVHFHVKRPVQVVHSGGWRPIAPAKPLHHHVEHVHVDPAPHVHVEHVHQTVPLQVLPRPLAFPGLFEVAKPDLGVLPLGAVFASPVLKEVPAPQLQPVPVALPPPVTHLHPIAQQPHLHVLPPTTHLHQVPAHLPHLHQVPAHLHPVGAEPHVHQVPAHLHPVGAEPHVHQVPAHLHPVGAEPHVHQVPVAHEHHVHQVAPALPHLHPVQFPALHTSAHIHPSPQLHQVPAQAPHFHQVPHLHQLPDNVQHLHQAIDSSQYLRHVPAQSPHLHQVPEPQPAVPQVALPPGVSVEYHGNVNFVNQLRGQAPRAPPQPPQLPDHFHLDYPQIPQVQNRFPQVPDHFPSGPQTPGDAPQGHAGVFPDHDRPPLDSQVHFDGGARDEAPRYQSADEASAQHFFRGAQALEQLDHAGYSYPRPENFIQPGATDVQVPAHLPRHPGFQSTQRRDEDDDAYGDPEGAEGRFRGPSYTEPIFKPSIQLEPPYEK